MPCGLKPLPLYCRSGTHAHTHSRHTSSGSAADRGLSHPVQLASLPPCVFSSFFPSSQRRQNVLCDCSKMSLLQLHCPLPVATLFLFRIVADPQLFLCGVCDSPTRWALWLIACESASEQWRLWMRKEGRGAGGWYGHDARDRVEQSLATSLSEITALH